MIHCEGYYMLTDYGYEYDCGYGAEFECDYCICFGHGDMDPRTNKKYTFFSKIIDYIVFKCHLWKK